MTEARGPNIAADLLRIHRVITRGLEVGLDRSRAFAQDGFPDSGTRQGFVLYVQALVAMLHGHHLSEDDIAFPFLRDRLAEAPFDVLINEHKQMEPLMDEIRTAIEAVGDSADPSAALNELNRTLDRMNSLWHAHIGKEEAAFNPDVVGPMLRADEHIQLAQASAKHSAENAGPVYLTVPFLLYNLSPEDRAVQSAAMPPEMIQELVPMVWKEKWAPMKPFLLD